MKTKKVQSKIGGAILVFSLLSGTGIALSTNAQAQDPNDRNAQDRERNDNGQQDRRGRNWEQYGNYGGSSELRQTALNAGYNEGERQGRDDRNRGNRSDFHNLSTYQNATTDYSRQLGDRELYRRYFREAFDSAYNADGYAQGNGDGDARDGNRDRNDNAQQDHRGRNWEQYGNYGGSSQLRQTALNAGYNEGVRQGSDDRNNGNRSDFHNQPTYQNATTGYSRRLGDRELYRRYFRESFDSAYSAEGFAQGNPGRDDGGGNRDRNDNPNQNGSGRNGDQYGNYGGTFQLRQTALNAGYNEGIKQGRSDRNKGDRNGYQGQSAYQQATHDYSSGLGDREVYRRYYREAYENGYQAGLNGN